MLLPASLLLFVQALAPPGYWGGLTPADPKAFAELAVRARATDTNVAGHDVVMMLLVDAVRRGAAERARTIYAELVARDSTVKGVPQRIRARANLFERIGAKDIAGEWRSMLGALGVAP